MRTMVFLLNVAMAIVIFPVASDAQGPADVEGWRSAKWGMSEAEILEAFKGEARRLDEPVGFSKEGQATVGIPDYSIDGAWYRVLFIFDGQGKLNAINIRPREKGSEGIYRSLEKLLMEKYGPLSYKNEERKRGGDKNWTARWNFPKTVISLRYIYEGPLPNVIQWVILHYQPRSKEADKL